MVGMGKKESFCYRSSKASSAASFFFNLVSEPGFPGTSSSNYLPVYDDLSVNSDFAFGFNTNSVANFLGVRLSL